MKIWTGNQVRHDGLTWTVSSVDNMNWDGKSPRMLEIYRGSDVRRVSRLVSEKEVKLV